MVFHQSALVYGVLPAIQNCVDAPSSEGEATPATMPCSPAGPRPSAPAHTSHDCQSVRFSMLLTVVPSTLGWEAATALDWVIGGVCPPPQAFGNAVWGIRTERVKLGEGERRHSS